MSDNLDDYVCLETDSLTLQTRPFLLEPLLETVVAHCNQVAQEQNIEVVLLTGLDLPQLVIGHQVQLRQVLEGLLYNAVKFTEGTAVSLTVMATQQDSTHWQLRFEIRDSSVQLIATEEFRHRSSSEKEPAAGNSEVGTEITLSLCQHLIERMGGELHVRNEREIGTHLPLHFTIAVGGVVKQPLTLHRLSFQPLLHRRTTLFLGATPPSQESVTATATMHYLRLWGIKPTYRRLLKPPTIDLPKISPRNVAQTQSQIHHSNDPKQLKLDRTTGEKTTAEKTTGEKTTVIPIADTAFDRLLSTRLTSYDWVIIEDSLETEAASMLVTYLRASHPDLPLLILTEQALPPRERNSQLQRNIRYLQLPITASALYNMLLALFDKTNVQ